jgi:uncharacterized protein (TIGR03503 family)
MTLLDNRFRVDESVERISFIVYREDDSRSVTLVRPDGRKYYASKHPSNVHWIEEPGVDIISIESPMAGPWQAIGKITPKNNIQLVSKLSLEADELPARVYSTERIKFTARLLSEGQPIIVENILDKVNLRVVVTRYVNPTDAATGVTAPLPQVIGEFFDDGQKLDEKAGDGVFTVELPMDIEPGKYNIMISTGNGVFLRAVEQTVLIYPTPFTVRLQPSVDGSLPHHVTVVGESATLDLDSLAAHVTLAYPDDTKIVGQQHVAKGRMGIDVALDARTHFGKHHWSGFVYANEASTGRPLVFGLPEKHFNVVANIDVSKAQEMQTAAREARKKEQQEAQIRAHREKIRTKSMLVIVLGNSLLLLLIFIGWWFTKKRRLQQESQPEMQLKMR